MQLVRFPTSWSAWSNVAECLLVKCCGVPDPNAFVYLSVPACDQDRSGDIHYLEFLAATIEAVGGMEVSGVFSLV